MATIDYAQLDYAELKRVYLTNLRMTTIAECDAVIEAIDALDLFRPLEVEQSGERISPRELVGARERARKRRGILSLTGRCPISIVPQDDLR